MSKEAPAFRRGEGVRASARPTSSSMRRRRAFTRSTRIYSSDALYYCGGEPTVKMETLRRELRRAVRDAEERSEQPANPKTGHGLVHQASHHAYWLGVRDGVKDALTRSKRVPL